MPQFDAQGLPAGYQFKPQHEISPRKLQEMLSDAAQRDKLLIVDVRLREEVDAARIEPYLHVPLHELESRVDEVLGEAAGKQVVTLCHHGVRSLKASLFLKNAGVANALSMAGGIDVWSQAIDAKVPRYERDGAQVRVLS